ncbi:MAG: hydrolase [Chloroflexi bacterium]|nr:hydrolase [Chloroflexota bacterium]
MKTILGVFLLGVLLAGRLQAQEATPEATATADKSLFFDDFNYTGTDSTDFSDHGWIVRTVAGWPGIPGAIWSQASISIVDDPDQAGNRMIEMHASSDGTTVHQAQMCQQRKFFEGTYASRVHFSDAPVSGPDGDNIVETFYQISPLAFDLDPNYSELDFEYLPNGGWGTAGNFLAVTSWETFRLTPWLADNKSSSRQRSYDGWHTLVMQVADEKIKYFVDSRLLDTHAGKVYPEVPMSLNYNLWFIDGGQIASTELRQYVEQIDWSFYAANTVLSPDEVSVQVAQMRADHVRYVNDVPAQNPPLESPCNF